MKTYFSIFYLGGLYAYTFKDIQNINLIFYFFFIAFCFYTLSMLYTVLLARNNDNLIVNSIENAVGEELLKKEKKPFFFKLQKISKIIYTLFFSISIIVVPLFNISLFSLINTLINALFVCLNIYYYIIIKDKLKSISDHVYTKYEKEKNDIKQFKEKEDNNES